MGLGECVERRDAANDGCVGIMTGANGMNESLTWEWWPGCYIEYAHEVEYMIL